MCGSCAYKYQTGASIFRDIDVTFAHTHHAAIAVRMRQRDEWTDVLACRGKRAHTYVMTARNCAEYGTRSVFLSYTVVIRDPTKGGNEGGRGAVGEPGLFFSCVGMHFSLTYAAARATPCVRA